MSLVTTVKRAVRDHLVARSGGIDLSRLDKVPDALSWPLKREVMAPSRRLQELREQSPVRRHASCSGWRSGWSPATPRRARC